MTLQDFISKYSGQFIDFDGVYGAQCVDEINQYLVDVLVIPNPISVLSGDTAFNIYKNYSGDQFEKITNTPEGVPQPGDIVFWDTSVSSAGHVAIFISGDQNSFTSLDQNWSTNSSVHEQYHSYNGVCGWLHPKADLSNITSISSPTLIQFTDQTQIPIGSDGVNDWGIMELQAIRSTLHDLKRDRDSALAQADDLKRQLTQAQQQLFSLTALNGSKTAAVTFSNPISNFLYQLAKSIG